MLLLLLVVTTAFACSMGQASEPKCSQFDYEEKTLYKMVRLEFTVEQAVNEVKQVLSDIKEEVGKIENERDEMKIEYERYKVDHDTAMNRLESMKDNLTSLAATPLIWFLVKDPVDKSLATNQVIVYSTVLHNEGNGYDASSGTFSAPIAGLYTFTMHACTYGKQCFYYAMKKEESYLVQGRDYNHDGYAVCSSATVYTNMGSGEKVWVTVSQVRVIRFTIRIHTGMSSLGL